MDHQLLPAHSNSAKLPADISSADAVRVWIDLMKSAEKLVMAGLIHQVGREKADAAYRQWYAEQASQHARYMLHVAKRLGQAGAI